MHSEKMTCVFDKDSTCTQYGHLIDKHAPHKHTHAHLNLIFKLLVFMTFLHLIENFLIQ